MTDAPDDGPSSTPAPSVGDVVAGDDGVVTSPTPSVDAANAEHTDPVGPVVDVSNMPVPMEPTFVAPPIVDTVPLSSQPAPAPIKRTLWSTRLSLLLVAALVGGLAGHYASGSSGSKGVGE